MNSKLFEIYLITNLCNNMKYVGVTCRDLDTRWREHLDHASSEDSQAPLHVAIREYGPSNFKIESILKDVPQENGRSKELEYISKYNSNEPNGYNTYRGGMGGHIHSEQGRRNISKGLEGHVFSESRNQKVRDAMINREYKQEWSDKLSEVRRGKFTKTSNGFYGKHHSKATLKQMQNTRVETSKKTIQYVSDSGDTIEFRSLHDAAVYVMNHGLSNTSVQTCSERISRNCRKNSTRPFYGGVWRFKERSID